MNKDLLRRCEMAGVFTVGLGLGALLHVGVSPLFVELVMIIACGAAMAVGYWMASGKPDLDREQIARAVERHRVTTGTIGTTATSPVVRVRHPVVTRPGDPEDDHREIPPRRTYRAR